MEEKKYELINKLHNLAEHPNTPVHEAKAAKRIINKLLDNESAQDRKMSMPRGFISFSEYLKRVIEEEKFNV